jgi:hypothetical protein
MPSPGAAPAAPRPAARPRRPRPLPPPPRRPRRPPRRARQSPRPPPRCPARRRPPCAPRLPAAAGASRCQGRVGPLQPAGLDGIHRPRRLCHCPLHLPHRRPSVHAMRSQRSTMSAGRLHTDSTVPIAASAPALRPCLVSAPAPRPCPVCTPALRLAQPAAAAAARTGVDVLAEVDGAAAAGAAGRLVQVLHAQALGLDELEEVGPLRLLDAAEQVVLRGRASAARRASVTKRMSQNRREVSAIFGTHAKAEAEFASWHLRAALLAMARNAESAAVGWEAAQTRGASPWEHRAECRCGASSGDARLEPDGDEAWALLSAAWSVSQPARDRQHQRTQRVRGSARARAPCCCACG